MYVSPSGITTNAGTLFSPLDLSTGLAVVSPTGTVHMLDGVYRADDLDLKSGITLLSESGTRPIITRTDDHPVSINIRENVTVDGVWFGGIKETVTERDIFPYDGATIKNCTFFGYYGGLAEGGHTNHLILNNRFVNCGTADHYHDMYISTNHAPSGCIVQGNIHISGEGYKVHCYNGVSGTFPQNVTILDNFYGDVKWNHAIYGLGHTILNNVYWSSQGGVNLNEVATFVWNHNVLGKDNARTFYHASAGQSADRNAIVFGNPSQSLNDPLGTNLSVWQESDIQTNLGKSTADINSAISSLEASFSGTVQQIHDDTTIENNFATLKNVIDSWKTK